MKKKSKLSVLLLSATLLSAPILTLPAYAHDASSEDSSCANCQQEALSESQRELVHSTLENLREETKGLHGELHKLRLERHDLLKADSFDKGAFLLVEAKIERKQDELAKKKAQAFASIADQLTPEEREHVAHMFGHHHRGHGHWGHHRKHHHRHHRHRHHSGWKHGAWKEDENRHAQTPAADGVGDAQTSPAAAEQPATPSQATP